MNDKASHSGGIGFVGLLTILFIGLKLTGFIEWSWLWVLAPIWMSILLVAVSLVLMLVLIGLDSYNEKNPFQ